MGGTFFIECGRHGRLVTVVAIGLVVMCWMGIEMVIGEKFEAVGLRPKSLPLASQL